MRLFPVVIAIVCCLTLRAPVAAQDTKHPFTVEDDIATVTFGGPLGDAIVDDMAQFSSDERYVVVSTSRGNLQRDRVEATLHFYRSADIERALREPASPLPAPFWEPSFHSEEGAVISQVHWLGDSSGVAFIVRNPGGRRSVELADVASRTTRALSASNEDAGEFAALDLLSRRDYVYVARLTGQHKPPPQQTAIIGTDRNIGDLVLTQSADTNANPMQLWAVIDGRRTAVKGETNEFAVSPDGRAIATRAPVTAPASWPETYRAPYKGDPDTIVAGSRVHEYARVDLADRQRRAAHRCARRRGCRLVCRCAGSDTGLVC